MLSSRRLEASYFAKIFKRQSHKDDIFQHRTINRRYTLHANEVCAEYMMLSSRRLEASYFAKIFKRQSHKDDIFETMKKSL